MKDIKNQNQTRFKAFIPRYEEPKSNPFQCVYDKNMKNQN